MAKILNLDNLSTGETREISIGGIIYPIKEMSVEDFVNTTKVAETLTAEASFEKQIEVTITLIVNSIPTIDKSVLYALRLEQLSALTAFIRGEDPEKLIAASKEAQGGDEGKQ